MKRQVIVLLLLLTLWLVSAVPAPLQSSTPVPEGLTAAEWQAIQAVLPNSYLKASNTNTDDGFGNSVAVSGNTVVIGAPTESSNATGVNGDEANNSASNAGAAYVFVRQNDIWSQQAYLKASNTNAGDYFGNSVAISDDTIVVGAYREDSNATGIDGNQSNNTATNSGAAYVFTRTNGVWSQQAYLKASNTNAQDEFGYNEAISGDTILIGAALEDSNAMGVNGDEGNTFLSAKTIHGANKRTSKPPTPMQETNLATLWPSPIINS